MAYASIDQTVAALANVVSTASETAADNTAWLNPYASGATGAATPTPVAAAVPANLADLTDAITSASIQAGQQTNQYLRTGFTTPPWAQPPDAFISFAPLAAINTPAVDSGDQVVLTLSVPPGYDGIIRRVTHVYNGPGFQEGSGGIIWRLVVDGQAVRNFDSMICSMGSPQSPRELDGGIRIFSGQTLEYVVNVAGGGGFVPSGGTQVICGLSGWFYPRQVA